MCAYYMGFTKKSQMLDLGHIVVQSVFWDCESSGGKYQGSNKTQISSLSKPSIVNFHFYYY